MRLEAASTKRRWNNVRTAFFGLALFVLGLAIPEASAPVHAETIIPGDHRVTTEETWSVHGSPYTVQGFLSIASTGHLTLEPGVEVQIESGKVFEVQDGGILTAEGTQHHPVTITASSDHFIGLRLWSGAHVSLAHCDLSHAGYSGWPAVDIQSSDVTLDHCTIHDNGVGDGHVVQLMGTGLSPTLTNTTIENNTGCAIYQSTIDMTPTYANLTLTGNGTDAVVWRHGNLKRALILDGPQLNGSPFVTLDFVSVASSAHLTLTAGTELRIPSGKVFEVQDGGILTAEGTQHHPVTITASSDHFIGLRLWSGAHVGLVHCDISQAGYSGWPAVDIQSSDVTLDHCTIHDNGVGGGHVVQLMGTGLSPTLTNTTIENNTGCAIYQSTIDMTPTYANLTLTDNGTDAVVLHGGTLKRTVTLDGRQLNGSPFISLGQVNIWSDGHLTLAPATELRMSADEAIYVESGGALTGEGTAVQPVILTSVEPGTWWQKAHFMPGSTGSLAYCEVSRAGASSFDALSIYTPDVSLGHCIVHDNAASGIRLFAGAGSPALDNVVLMDNGIDGLRVESGTAPAVRHATIARNGDDGVHIVAGGAAVFTNTMVAGNGVGVRVASGGSATMARTLWDGNGQDTVGTVEETGRFEASAALGPDGYHLTSGSAALQRGVDAGVLDDIDGEARPQPAGTPPDLGADESLSLLQAWDKWIDGQPWRPAFTCTVEISNTVEIVDVIWAEPDAPVTLLETWTAGQLSLTETSVEPPDTGEVITAAGSLTWVVPAGHPETMTLTKRVHLDPGPWTEASLVESLDGVDVANPDRQVIFSLATEEGWEIYLPLVLRRR